MVNLLSPFGFPEIAIIVVLSLAALILLTLNIAFLLYRTSKKEKKSRSAALRKGKQGTAASGFYEKQAKRRKGRDVVLFPFSASPSREEVLYGYSRGVSWTGGSHGPAMPPSSAPLQGSLQPQDAAQQGHKTDAAEQDYASGLLPPIVLPPLSGSVVLIVPDARNAPVRQESTIDAQEQSCGPVAPSPNAPTVFVVSRGYGGGQGLNRGPVELPPIVLPSSNVIAMPPAAEREAVSAGIVTV